MNAIFHQGWSLFFQAPENSYINTVTSCSTSEAHLIKQKQNRSQQYGTVRHIASTDDTKRCLIKICTKFALYVCLLFQCFELPLRFTYLSIKLLCDWNTITTQMYIDTGTSVWQLTLCYERQPQWWKWKWKWNLAWKRFESSNVLTASFWRSGND